MNESPEANKINPYKTERICIDGKSFDIEFYEEDSGEFVANAPHTQWFCRGATEGEALESLKKKIQTNLNNGSLIYFSYPG